jgi:hypothetical protein
MAINLKTFAKDLTYRADTSVRQIFKDFKEIAEIKQLAEQKAGYFGTLVGYSVVLIVLITFGIFVWFFALAYFLLSDGRSFGFLILLIFGLSILFILIFTTIFWSMQQVIYYNKLKLREDRCELPKKILSMVKRDLTPNSNVKIMIHFNPTGEMGKIIQTLPHPRKRDWKLDIVEDQWLTLEGKFIDSTKFFLTVTELNRRAYGVNARGTSKIKNKPKGTEINLKLSFPRKKYGSIHVIQKAAPEAVKLPEEVNLKRIKVTPKVINLTVNTPQNLNQEEMYQTITMMFLSLYQVLNFAKLLSKRRAS